MCRTDLSAVWDEETVNPGSDVTKTQEAIYALIDHSRDSMDSLRTLYGAAAAVNASEELELIAELAGLPSDGLIGFVPVEENQRQTLQLNAMATAALTTAAHKLVTAPEETVADAIRRITFSRRPRADTRVNVLGPGGVSAHLKFWGSPNETTTRRVLRALDSDLPDRERMKYGSSLPQRLRRPLPDMIKFDPEALPKLLWPSWAIPLNTGRAFRDSLRLPPDLAAVLEKRKRETQFENLQHLLAEVMAGPAHSRYSRHSWYSWYDWVATTSQMTKVISGLSFLGLKFTQGNLLGTIPIRYDRRRQLPWETLAPRDVLQLILRSNSSGPIDTAEMLTARCYMYVRLTGNSYMDAFTELKIANAAVDRTRFVEFQINLTVQRQAAIDGYLKHFMKECERLPSVEAFPYDHFPIGDEPIVWSPSRDLNDLRFAVGPELEDIDWDRLYSMSSDGTRTLAELASELKRTPEHVRHAIDRWPLDTGDPVIATDWPRQLGQSAMH